MAMTAMTAAQAGNNNDDNNKDASGEKSAAAIENIMTRCSVRQYTNQPVAKETVDTLLKAAMAAPTASNKQPWAFIVVDEQALKDSITAVLKYGHPIAKAPVAIVVCGDLQKSSEDINGGYWIQDCSAATENILLAAHAVGLGAVWCGVYPREERVANIRRILNLPDNLVPLNVIAIGYPSGKNSVKNKFKPENIHYNKF